MVPLHDEAPSHVIFHSERADIFLIFKIQSGKTDAIIVQGLKMLFTENMEAGPKVAEIVNICERLESEIQIRPPSQNASTKLNNLMEGPRRQNLKKAARQMALRNREENKHADVSDCVAKFMKEFDIDESRNYLEQFGLVLKQVENEANCITVHDGL
eukprot:PITA_32581